MSETAGLKKVKFIPRKLLSDGLTYLKEQRNEGKWLSLLPLQFHSFHSQTFLSMLGFGFGTADTN